MLLLIGLDAMLCIVLIILLPPRDNQKCYRFTPPVSNWRMLEAVSVDALSGFGAKKFNRCTDFTQFGIFQRMDGPLFISHFSVFGNVLVP